MKTTKNIAQQLIEHFASSLFSVKGVYRYTVPAGNFGTQKSLPWPGFIFPLSGSAEYHFNSSPYLVTAGTIVHGPANSDMYKRVVGSEDWQFISVLYEMHKEPSAMRMAAMHFELNVKPAPCLYALLHKLADVYNQPGAFAAFHTETTFRMLLEECLLAAVNQDVTTSQALFSSVSAYIHAHYSEEMSVAMLAEKNSVNENRLFYVFQKYSGMGPGEYLRTYRLNRARELLVTNDISVADVAQQVGYTDPLYFSRLFKKRFGVPPSRFAQNEFLP